MGTKKSKDSFREPGIRKHNNYPMAKNAWLTHLSFFAGTEMKLSLQCFLSSCIIHSRFIVLGERSWLAEEVTYLTLGSTKKKTWVPWPPPTSNCPSTMTLYSEEEFPERKSGEDEWIGQPIKTNVHKETNILD